MVCYELLKPGETTTTVRCKQQLMKLNQALKQKRPEYAKRHDNPILLHDNARPHVVGPVKNIYTGHELGTLMSPAIFSEHTAIWNPFVA